MSDITLAARARLLKERYDQAGNEEDIEVSGSFLAEDYRDCVKRLVRLAAQPFIDYNAAKGYHYVDCKCKLERGRWKRNPALRNGPTSQEM